MLHAHLIEVAYSDMNMTSILLPRRTFMAGLLAASTLRTAQAEKNAHDGAGRHGLVIGQSVALSGPQAGAARPYHQGARVYFDRLNVTGGIHGRRIELLTLDDYGEPATAVANTRKLLDRGVLCLFGYYGSPQVAAAYPLVRDAGILMFAPLAAADTLRGEQFPNVYTLRPDYAQETAAIARHAQTLGARKLGILHAGDGEALAGLDAARRSLPQLGARLVAEGTISAGGVGNVLAAGPESIVIIAGTREAADAVRQLRTKQFHRPVYVFSNAGESLLADELGAAGAGVVVARVVPGTENAQTSIARELVATATAERLGRPNVYMMEGYLAAHVLAQALRQVAAEPTPARLRSAIEKVHDLDAGGFRVHYARDRVGSKLVELALIDSQGRIRE